MWDEQKYQDDLAKNRLATIERLRVQVLDDANKLAALRAELDAAKAANATLEAERDEAIAALDLVVNLGSTESYSIASDLIHRYRPAPDTNRDAGDESGV